MNTPTAIYNTAALIFSLIAIVIAVMSSRRQSEDVRRSNLILFMTELGQRNRGQEFRKALDYIHAELSKFDPALGVYGLPEPAAGHVLLVGGFYQDVGVLVVTGVMDEDLAATLYYSGIKDTWRTLEPYVRGEREIRKTKFFAAFEHLAVYVDSMPLEKVRQKFIRRSFPTSIINNSAGSDGKAIDSLAAGGDLG
jgi:hypothetical protein